MLVNRLLVSTLAWLYAVHYQQTVLSKSTQFVIIFLVRDSLFLCMCMDGDRSVCHKLESGVHARVVPPTAVSKCLRVSMSLSGSEYVADSAQTPLLLGSCPSAGPVATSFLR